MIEFWFAVVLMTGLIITAIVRFARTASTLSPETNTTSGINHSRAIDNLQLYKQRLSELEQLLAQGDIDSQAYSSLIIEARSQLYVDLGKPTSLKPTDDIEQWVLEQAKYAASGFDKYPSSRKALYLLAILIPLLALALYLPQGLSVGGSFELQVAKQLKLLQSASDARQRQQQLLSISQLLEQQVSASRSKLELLQLQAEIYSALEQHSEASAVYSQLMARDSSSAALTALYAQSLYLRDAAAASAGVSAAELMSQQVKDLLTSALRLDPQQYLALSMSGMQAFSEADYPEAIRHWRAALISYGESSPQAASLNAGIQAAETRLAASTATKTVNTTDASQQTSAHIRLRISIAPEQLSTADSPDTPVFVFARAVSGSAMPLAAKRLRLSDLPIEVLITENDKMATQSIAGQSELIVAARLARSGQAIATAGDSQSSEIRVAVAASADKAAVIELRINKDS